MHPSSVGKLAVVVFIGGAAAASFVDRAANYQETDAVITSVDKDCYVKNRRSKLVDSKTDKLAYMPCDLAPIMAEAHGYSKTDVFTRAKLTYRYTSPVDGKNYVGDYTASAGGKAYKLGAKIKIYAHSKEPAKSRMN